MDTARLGSRRPVFIAVLLAAAIGLVELPFSSFMADDFIQLGFLEGVSPCRWMGPFNLHTISDGDPEAMESRSALLYNGPGVNYYDCR